MSSDNREHRGFIKRQNQSFALYLLIECWKLKIDGIEISYQNIKDFSGLKKLDKSRKEYLIEDFQSFFEFAEDMGDKIIFSRLKIEGENKSRGIGSIEVPRHGSPEAQVIAHLALLSQGLIEPGRKLSKDLPVVYSSSDLISIQIPDDLEL